MSPCLFNLHAEGGESLGQILYGVSRKRQGNLLRMRSAKDKDKYKRDKGFQDEDLCPGEGVMKEENFLHARKNPTSRARGEF